MIRRTLAMLAAVAVVLGAIAGFKVHAVKQEVARLRASAPPPPSVSTIVAATSPWERRVHCVGTFEAVEGVTVSTQIDGAVVAIAFASGQHVRAGDLLVQQDISTDQAQLHGFAAQADLARITLARARTLRASDTNAQADLDAAEAQYRVAAAAVENARAVIAKKTIRAPFAGVLGIRLVNLGQFLPAGGAIASLQRLDPIYVDFTVPQQRTGDVRPGQVVDLEVDAYPGRVFTGRINAVNSVVDDATRNVEVQATVANPGERLLPGMFAAVDLILQGRELLVTLPETAIVYNPYGDAVYVIERPGSGGAPVARQHFVTVGEARGDQVAILRGVSPGDEVVTAGQLKLRNGLPVVIENSVQPPNQAQPEPPDT